MSLSKKEISDRKALIKKIQSYGNISAKGALKFHCGEKIGHGLNRDVYVLKHNPEWVVKIQRTTNFDNIIEYQIWDAIKYADFYSKWFAECLTISETGVVLFQRRVEFRDKKYYPKKIPKWFTDTKIANYGFVNSQLVCCDYSNVLGMLTGFMTKDLKNAKWWEHKVRNPKRIKNMVLSTNL